MLNISVRYIDDSVVRMSPPKEGDLPHRKEEADRFAALALLMNGVGIAHLSSRNLDEFVRRADLYQACIRPMNAERNGRPIPFTRRDFEDFLSGSVVRITANVTPVEASDFNKMIEVEQEAMRKASLRHPRSTP
ncbi:hypothetical protein [Streptomyces sp. NPDC059278]|uniref:hypothetical protein n=1 Tax=Streptomyces sp. NPDC059278 TaxID=3346801 RepID=UPI00368FE826